MSDELPLEERVANYLERHPDAGVATIAGALNEAPPAVADVLDQDTPESGQEPNSRTRDRVRGSGSRPRSDRRRDRRTGPWSEADFATPDAGVYPEELLEREQWMGHQGKKPFAPWADRDHPDAGADEDARWKWGIEENYVDGETVAMAEVDPRLDGRAYLQQPDDPYVYVDGDDVRDPETGDVHPAFVAILEHLGLTYADVSQSGAGVHSIYRGELPGDVKQASWQLDDDPWGDNDELPSIEVYPGKRVCVMTGAHVPGTPTEIAEWNDDVLDALLEANDEVASRQRDASLPDPDDVSTDRDDYDLEDYEPRATSAAETTDDIRDVFAALDRLDARDVAAKTIVHRWNDSASTSAGKRAFAPTWGPNSNGTANVVDDRIWQDTGDLGGYGGPVVMALIDAGEMRPSEASPRRATGRQWFRGIEHLQDLGFGVPTLESGNADEGDVDEDSHPLLEDAIENGDDVDAGATSALPLAQLEALPHDERRRAARRRGLDWPSTDDARDQLLDTIKQAMRHEDETVVDAPTSLGKSYSVATTRWGAFDDVTGNRPVVHLSATRDARDEAAEAAAEHGGDHFVLLSRHEACPVAAGDHDPKQCRESDRQPITIDGEPASQWLDRQCEGKGLPFSAAHQYLADHKDQAGKLPCCRGSSTTYDEDEGDFDTGEPAECEAIRQWETLRELDVPLVIATHNFAHVPSLRMQANVVIDEEPDFEADLSKERIERAITAFLQAADAPVSTWESFISLVDHDDWRGDAAAERDQLQDCLDYEPDREWFLENADAHTLAPALARAIFYAEDRGNGRRFGKTPHEPPRLDANAGDDDAWNRVWVSITMDQDNDVRTVRTAPDLSQARSVIGLDAHPAQPVWAVNTVPHIDTTPVLEPEERRLWRRFERGLRVVQVGDATRPLASGEYFKRDQVEAMVEQLREEYGDEFQTAITASSVEHELQDVLSDAGVDDVVRRDQVTGDVEAKKTMHYGEEKSRNDFADEGVGLVEGCIDPGDDYVLDLLAELDLDAEPETVDVDGAEERAHGRGFEGPDADTAAAILASVRENHTAQAAGRYARNPDDPESHATVFVRTDAMPTDFADVQVSGVQWTFSETQRAIVDELRRSTTSLTTTEIADAVGCTKEHVRRTLRRLEEMDAVQALDGAGAHGATLFADDGLPNSGVVDLNSTTNSPVLDPYTWSLAIRDPADLVGGDEPAATTDQTPDSSEWDWESAASQGDPPS